MSYLVIGNERVAIVVRDIDAASLFAHAIVLAKALADQDHLTVSVDMEGFRTSFDVDSDALKDRRLVSMLGQRWRERT